MTATQSPVYETPADGIEINTKTPKEQTLPDNKAPVLVTGGSGFIALHLISQLLRAGYTVHSTVRNLKNADKVAPLRELAKKHDGEGGHSKLRIYEADLLVAGSFKSAMQECETVFHVASPFMMAEKIKDGQKECVDPALKGTQNVLQSVNETETVTRVVLTSSIGAVAGDYADVLSMDNKIMHEKYFNESSSVTHNPYHYSKVVAEKKAWEMCNEQTRWSLVVICPGLVLGPSLSPTSQSGSLFLLDELLRGQLFFGVPDLILVPVDVRDVAKAHIEAAEKPEANGRYIVAFDHTVSFVDISSQLKARHPGIKSYLIPKHRIPNGVTRVLGPLFGLSKTWMQKNLGVTFKVDNSRGIKELGITYRPLSETLSDHYDSWAALQAKSS